MSEYDFLRFVSKQITTSPTCDLHAKIPENRMKPRILPIANFVIDSEGCTTRGSLGFGGATTWKNRNATVLNLSRMRQNFVCILGRSRGPRMKRSKGLVVVSHPDRESFNHALAKAVVTAWERSGVATQLLDLDAINFNPVLDLSEVRGHATDDPLVLSHVAASLRSVCRGPSQLLGRASRNDERLNGPHIRAQCGVCFSQRFG